MSISENIQIVYDRIEKACIRAGRKPSEVTLVAVTKTVAPEAVRAAYESGIRHFGENRVQEAQSKLGQLADIRKQTQWHMIGHLQTNKAKTAITLFDIIQSIDSLRVAEAISQQAVSEIPVYIEVNVAQEETKEGFSTDEITEAAAQISRMSNLKIEGLMTVAPWGTDPEEVRPVFAKLRQVRDMLGLKALSMGMTDDFEVAIEEGATHIRVGRAIFGKRRG